MNETIVLCPFYMEDRRKGVGIKCQGLYDGTENTITFKNQEQKIKHKKKYCETFEYNECRYAKVLMEEE